MKTRKLFIVMAIIAIIAIVVIGCKQDEPADTPKDQTATITNLFGEGFTATVKGTLTDTEWNGVADKIKTALNDEYSLGWQSSFEAVFGQPGGVTIIVEKNPAYANYSTTNGGNTMKINFAVVNNATTLQAALLNAMKATNGFGDITG
jgi:hypothetical protein